MTRGGWLTVHGQHSMSGCLESWWRPQLRCQTTSMRCWFSPIRFPIPTAKRHSRYCLDKPLACGNRSRRTAICAASSNPIGFHSISDSGSGIIGSMSFATTVNTLVSGRTSPTTPADGTKTGSTQQHRIGVCRGTPCGGPPRPVNGARRLPPPRRRGGHPQEVPLHRVFRHICLPDFPKWHFTRRASAVSISHNSRRECRAK